MDNEKLEDAKIEEISEEYLYKKVEEYKKAGVVELSFLQQSEPYLFNRLEMFNGEIDCISICSIEDLNDDDLDIPINLV